MAELARLLEQAWRFPVADLRYAPVGFGSHHWVATDTSGARRFVTVDELDDQRPGGADGSLERLRRAMLTAYALKEAAGLSCVVAPVLGVDGAVLRRLEPGYAASVFPFLDGRPYPAGERSTPQERAAIVEVLAQVHAATPTTQAYTGVDDLELPDRAVLERALDQLRVPWTGGPFAEATRELLVSNAADVRLLLREYDRLADVARNRDVPWVVTHGEPKPDNFLATDAGLMLLDWDTALVAPPARDLWMVDAGAGEECAYYADLTGYHIRPDELTLYRLAWDLADIASYVREFTAPHARTADSEIGWNALSQTLRLQGRWPELL